MGEVLRKLLSAEEVNQTLNRMADEIAVMIKDYPQPVLVGIRSRGVPLAKRIQKLLAERGRPDLPIGTLDITLYRDDLTTLGAQPVVGQSDLPFDLADHTVVLIDDVLFTGRTIRAALEALVAYDRPKAVRLAILADRGHREYPIQADVVGLKIETSLDENVKVQLNEIDGQDGVDIQRI